MKERASSPNIKGLRREYTRLKSRVLIQSLFDRNSPDVVRVSVGSISLVYRQESIEALNSFYPMHLGFAVNRSVSRAVDRNRIKRLMREAFRVQIGVLTPHIPSGKSLLLMVVFRSSKLDSPLEADMERAIQKMKSNLVVN